MATTESTPAPTDLYEKGAVHADDLSSATVKDGILFDVKDLEVYFPIQQGFFKAMVSTEKKFVKAVDCVSFQIKQGEILALVGESGCGFCPRCDVKIASCATEHPQMVEVEAGHFVRCVHAEKGV